MAYFEAVLSRFQDGVIILMSTCEVVMYTFSKSYFFVPSFQTLLSGVWGFFCWISHSPGAYAASRLSS